MRLYHGSYTAVEQPETTKGREKVDFGQGFYLTNIQSQAEKWSLYERDQNTNQKLVFLN